MDAGSAAFASAKLPPAPPAPPAPPDLRSSDGKAAASADWEFAHTQLIWVREIGRGGFGTVYEVRRGGMEMAAKKIVCTVESERQAIVAILRREFRALSKVANIEQ